jgi:hypothetical protein
MKRMCPQHYAMVFFGFISGARPSTLRPLRRQGEVTDLKWDERVILLRRSNSLGDEIMDETKTTFAVAVRTLEPTDLDRCVGTYRAELHGLLAVDAREQPAPGHG